VNAKDDFRYVSLIVQIGSLEDEGLGHSDAPDELEEMVDILRLLVSMFAFLP
jgi:hypothetical protein